MASTHIHVRKAVPLVTDPGPKVLLPLPPRRRSWRVAAHAPELLSDKSGRHLHARGGLGGAHGKRPIGGDGSKQNDERERTHERGQNTKNGGRMNRFLSLLEQDACSLPTSQGGRPPNGPTFDRFFVGCGPPPLAFELPDDAMDYPPLALREAVLRCLALSAWFARPQR